jgi:PTH1 family peptidyl-tRNA hydrolase
VFRRRKDGSPRRGTQASWVIVGLANPGVEYRGTRHNLGADVVEELASRLGATLRVETRLRSRAAEVDVDGERVLLAVPTTYVNESGAAAAPLVRRGGLEDVGRLVVAHDELDLAPGRLQVKVGGGLAGHNGLRSIAAALDSEAFVRLRIGIGKPGSKDQGADFVLSRPNASQRAQFDVVVHAGADALEALVHSGLDAAIAQVNGSARG